MKYWVLIFLFFTACQEASHHSLELETDTGTGIVGGGNPVPFEHPLTSKALQIITVTKTAVTKTNKGTLTTRESANCTGAAISKRIILTAAHCLRDGKAEKYMVSIPVAGGEFVNFQADYLAIHGAYKSQDVDLALLRLPADLPKEVTILKLPEPGEPFQLQSIQAAGYGDTSGRAGHVSDGGVLRATNLDVINYKSTAQFFEVDQKKGRGICLGDSGGPAMINVNNETYVVGVVAGVTFPTNAPADFDKCTDRGQYVNIYPYLKWIKEASTQLLEIKK